MPARSPCPAATASSLAGFTAGPSLRAMVGISPRTSHPPRRNGAAVYRARRPERGEVHDGPKHTRDRAGTSAPGVRGSAAGPLARDDNSQPRRGGLRLLRSLLQDLDNPLQFVTMETWASDAAMQAHMASPHVQDLFARLPPLLSAEPELGQDTGRSDECRRKTRWLAQRQSLEPNRRAMTCAPGSLIVAWLSAHSSRSRVGSSLTISTRECRSR